MDRIAGDQEIEKLMSLIHTHPDKAIEHINKLMLNYPDDARLYFLRGSICVGKGLLIEGHEALSKAVKIAPDFAIARFQLGFFQLTSGEPENATSTWARLHELPEGHYLKSFVKGLNHLMKDEFSKCISYLEMGIESNMENEPLNNDMRLIINQVMPLTQNEKETIEDELTSTTSFLLNQYSQSNTKH